MLYNLCGVKDIEHRFRFTKNPITPNENKLNKTVINKQTKTVNYTQISLHCVAGVLNRPKAYITSEPKCPQETKLEALR
jgi:hypothetical protein